MNPEAEWWTEKNGEITCLLCPHYCLLSDGDTGICGVRQAVDGGLTLPGYGMLTASAADPVEKKPLYHFYPGETVWSVGFTGCNMDCPYCQNYRISRARPSAGVFRSPEEIVSDTISCGSEMLAFTYSEPTVHYEYLMKSAEIAHNAGLKTILVTNGNINLKPARNLLSLMDAVNIDLKSWDDAYYRTILRGNLNTVKDFIEESLAHSWVELTTLIVPGDNDNVEELGAMSRWIASLSLNIPLHLSAYHPSYRYQKPATSESVMITMQEKARETLNFVYLGNIGRENGTLCPGCSSEIIRRKYYRTESLIIKGRCPECGTEIPGVFPGGSVPYYR
ncbi:MAG: AmmeMemoRadiSam system radical SAM enzyme [Spirochaetaceae bacterium]|nr:AmmeMemoRadiSam system radical SAM enzyme [Spirochaetaceae bacterium]